MVSLLLTKKIPFSLEDTSKVSFLQYGSSAYQNPNRERAQARARARIKKTFLCTSHKFGQVHVHDWSSRPNTMCRKFDKISVYQTFGLMNSV